MLRIAELNTWRSARKHADPKPSRGGVATVRGRVIAACAAAGLRGERSYCKRRNVAPVLGRLRIAVRTEYLEVCRHSQPVSCLVFRQRKPNYWGKCLHNGRGRGREGWNSKAEGVTKANGQNRTLGGLTARLNDQSLAVENERPEGGKPAAALWGGQAGRSQGVDVSRYSKGL